MWLLLLASVLPARADDLKLFLQDPHGRPAPLDKCDVELCTSLLGIIENAKTSIDFAFYGFRNQTRLFEALKAARDRGVQIRGVVDMDVNGVNYYDSTPVWLAEFPNVRTDHQVDLANQASQRSFSNMKYPCPRPSGFEGPLQCAAFDLGDRCYLAAHASREPITYQGDIMHDKFMVVDGRYVWMGSTNASDSCSGGYNGNLVMVVDSPTVALWYTIEFEQMFQGRFHDKKEAQSAMRTAITDDIALEVMFSPQNKPITNGVRPLLQQARSSIDIAVFFLTHKGITQDLIDAKNRGVKVRVILDTTGAGNEYSKHEVLRAAGIPVKVEDVGGKMHAKSVVIDHEILIGGSMNWTNAGEEGNDENTIILRSRKHAQQFESWFDQFWKEIPDKWLTGRPDPESRDSGTACTDGVDNDYDHLVDKDDPGCSANPPALPPRPPDLIVPKKDGRCNWDIVAIDADE